MQKPFNRTLLLIWLAVLLTSCITTHQTNYLQHSKTPISSFSDSVSYNDYTLKVDDRLYIQIYSLDEKTNMLFNGDRNSGNQIINGSGNNQNLDLFTYTIQSNGCIDFPLIGEVSIEGKTIRETKKIIEDAIRPILAVNSVDVRMVGRSFSIIGAGKSGRYSFPKEKVNIYQAIAMAGDLGYYVDRSKIKILRETKDGTQIKTFDIRSVSVINSEFYYLEPNDVIFLQPMNEQFFKVSSLWTAISTIITTYSFGVVIYKTFSK